MKWSAAWLVLVWAVASGSAQAVQEFRTDAGLVRISRFPQAPIPADSLGKTIPGAPADTADIASLLARRDAGDVLLDIYYLDKASGAELRFPVKVSQVRAFLRRHGREYSAGSRDERAVAWVGGLSRELRVRMRTPGSGGGSK